MSERIDTLTAKIAAQEEKLKQLKAQKAKAERRLKAALQKRERANDTRRKILIGAMVMEQIKRGEIAPESIRNTLNPFLKRNADRELFGLPPLETGNGQNLQEHLKSEGGIYDLI